MLHKVIEKKSVFICFYHRIPAGRQEKHRVATDEEEEGKPRDF